MAARSACSVSLLRDPGLSLDLFRAGFEPFDLVFWAIATYEGWKLTQAAVRRMQARAVAARQPAPPSAAYYPQDGRSPGHPGQPG